MKVLGVNTLVFLALAIVLTPNRLEFLVQQKLLDVNTLASTKLVGIRSDKCWVLWPTTLKSYGGVRVIKKGALNLVLINKFIQCH